MLLKQYRRLYSSELHTQLMKLDKEQLIADLISRYAINDWKAFEKSLDEIEKKERS